jgi:hypothetical protein
LVQQGEEPVLGIGDEYTLGHPQIRHHHHGAGIGDGLARRATCLRDYTKGRRDQNNQEESEQPQSPAT